MIFRKIKAHIEKENWFAVCIDFLIVVVGVFIGIQVANWNESNATYQRETQLLKDLKSEIQKSIVTTNHLIDSFEQVAAAGKRSLQFIDAQKPCEQNCWAVVVDFMHASQWQDISVRRSTYESMRNLGFPKNTQIVDAVESYLNQNSDNADVMRVFPYYRTLVRQIVPYDAAESYWANCYSLVDGTERYVLDCKQEILDEEAKRIVGNIVGNPKIKPHLNKWFGDIVSFPQTFRDQNQSAQYAISLIDQELKKRR